GVVLAGLDRSRGQHERGSATGTSGLDVDDGHTRHPETAQHLVARGHSPIGGPAECGLEPTLAHTGLAQCSPHGLDAHVCGGDTLETTKGMDPHSGNDDAGHDASAGAKANVTTSRPSASVCNGTMRNC